jgi:predicted dehydrogenase/threonine dehydrogenase-like Zn-dependent dehydrogenase
MRQLVMNMSGVAVIRMPRPIVLPGTVLIRVRNSLVSVGTEVAPLRPSSVSAPDTPPIERGLERARQLRHYARASARDPRKAIRRLSQIAERRVARLRKSSVVAALADPPAPGPDLNVQGWAIGYSASGEVVAVGEGITDLAAGDIVAAAGAGQANHADYVVVPRNLVCRVPDGCSMAHAASATVGSIALQGLRRASPQLGESVCVIGLGLIGQITVQLLKAAGCRVIGLDLDAERLQRAQSLGLDAGATDADALKNVVRDLTRGYGADRTLLTAATKSNTLINLAMDVTRAKGSVVIVGDVGLNVDRAVFYRKEIDLLMSTSYGPGRYDASYEAEGHDYPLPYVRWTLNRNMQAYLELVASGKVNFEALTDQVVNIEDAPHVYDRLAKGEGGLPLAVVLDYAGADTADASPSSIALRAPRKASGPRLQYALVGAGAFGTGMLVPQMRKRGDRYSLRAVVARTGMQGANFAREHQVELLTSDLDAVLNDSQCDLVVIATRHHEHAEQVRRALAAGKHVFVEKPLAISWNELEGVADVYSGLQAPPMLMVGFNRRFSPALQTLNDRLKGRRSPLVIQYRVNAGYLPLDHWVHGPQGGGRNIGEACHMYDVCRFLAGAPVRTVTAAAIDPGALPYARNDNFSATLTYEDGSIATLVYTSLGPKAGLGKEHITVFADGEAFIVDDFKKLTKASDGSALWQSGEVDKGHFQELSLFGDAIAGGGDPPIPFDEIIETSAVALQVEDLLVGRTQDNE